MSSAAMAIEAFNVGAGSTATDISQLIIAIIFAVLLTVFAYILIKLFDEVKADKLKFSKFSLIVVRILLLVLVLGYFLLH
ncbi:TIGR03758 family integrating conjugative element protein [Pasteurellaceae bacterium LIM206]|nr:TIGR03758 family integrating conjugative element protein [Pasteurellaceae bacterium LIM206]